MILLGLDFETTWSDPVDPTKMLIVEAGAVLYDTERQMPIDMYNKLVAGVTVTEDMTALTGIIQEDIENHGLVIGHVLDKLNEFLSKCDYVVAHNGNKFDKIVYETECRRNNVYPVVKPWIDTRVDIEYPPQIKSRKLVHLAAEHGFANPFAHRALFDVLTMLKVLENYDIREVAARSLEPSVLCGADVSFHEKDLAKARGYFWNSEEREWQKELKKSMLQKELNEAPFKIFHRELT